MYWRQEILKEQSRRQNRGSLTQQNISVFAFTALSFDHCFLAILLHAN